MNKNTAYTSSGRGSEYLRDMCDGWRFGGESLDASEVTEISYDDSAWELVDIPHTWNIKDAEDGGNDYLRTAFWYRKVLEYDEKFEGKKIFLEFNANIYKKCFFSMTHNINMIHFNHCFVSFTNKFFKQFCQIVYFIIQVN